MRAFNATDMFPPNPAGIGNVIGDRAPVKSQLYPQSRRKVCAGTVASGIISHQETPRDNRVSAPIHQSRLCHRALEPTCSFPEKDRAMEVSALTTPNVVSAMEYKRARMQTNTRWHTREKFRRYTHSHRQVHYEQDGSRSCRYGSLE